MSSQLLPCALRDTYLLETKYSLLTAGAVKVQCPLIVHIWLLIGLFMGIYRRQVPSWILHCLFEPRLSLILNLDPSSNIGCCFRILSPLATMGHHEINSTWKLTIGISKHAYNLTGARQSQILAKKSHTKNLLYFYFLSEWDSRIFFLGGEGGGEGWPSVFLSISYFHLEIEFILILRLDPTLLIQEKILYFLRILRRKAWDSR